MESDEDELVRRLEELRMWQDQQLGRSPLNQEQLQLMKQLGLSLDSDAFLPGSDCDDADLDDNFFENIERQIDELRSGNSSMVGHSKSNNSVANASFSSSRRNNLDDTPVMSRKNMDFNATPLKTIDLNQINVDDVLSNGHGHGHQDDDGEADRKIIKRPFLKKGEGLTARFRVPPEHFNLKNIPKYVAPKRHSISNGTTNSNSNISKQSLPLRRSSTGQSLSSNSKASRKLSLNANNKNGKSLRRAQTVPAVGSSGVGTMSSSSSSTATATNSNKTSTKTSPTDKQPPSSIKQAWEDEFRANASIRTYRLTEATTQEHMKIFQTELDELSSFERIEKKIENNESITSTPPQNQNPESIEEEHQENCKQDDDTDNDDYELAEQQLRPYNHVHFSSHVEVNHANEETDTETIASSDMEPFEKNLMSTPNERGFAQFKAQLVLNELSQTIERSSKDVTDDTLLDQRQELNDIKETLISRLKDLEDEIAMFQKENAALIKMKQDHELEKARLEQERDEMEAKLSDERIKMEVFFHDERMKIKEKHDNLDRRIKEIQKPSRKERDEVLRLNDKITQLEAELKAKEVKHGAAQARFRTQIRQLEKQTQEQKLEIDSLKRDNKRLETENVRLRRENNSKMLQEINKNIAKLTVPPPSAISSSATTPSEERARLKNVVAKVNSNAPSSRRQQSKHHVDIRRSSAEEDLDSSENDDENYDVNGNSADLANVVVNSNGGGGGSSYFKRSKISPVKGITPLLQRVPSQVKTPTTPTTDLNKKETLNADGSKDIYYANGNLKKISADGMVIKMLYFNNDIKETNINEGTIKYYYAANNTWQTTYSDGKEVLEFPNGQIENRYKDGRLEVNFPNGSKKLVDPALKDVAERWTYPDGTKVDVYKNDDKILYLPNGQREIHTKDHKRREYPDGSVKIVYNDGSQETRYSNGRIRLKDKDGNLIRDTEGMM